MINLLLSCLLNLFITIILLELFNLKDCRKIVDHKFWYYKLYSHFENKHYEVYSENALIVSLQAYYEDWSLPMISKPKFPGFIFKYYIHGYGLVITGTRLANLIDNMFKKQ